MPRAEPTSDDAKFLKLALEQAQKSYAEGGVPIGSVMVEDGQVIAAGHNRRVQDGDPIAMARWTASVGPAGAPNIVG